MEFRLAYWRSAAKATGAEADFETARFPHDLLSGVSDEHRRCMVHALVYALAELEFSLAQSDGVGTILQDLDSPLIRHGVPISLDEQLAGAEVGQRLQRMRQHAAQLDAERRARAQYEAPEAVQERRRAKREAAAVEQERRKAEKLRRDMARKELLEELSASFDARSTGSVCM
jgi:hypothetical protein